MSCHWDCFDQIRNHLLSVLFVLVKMWLARVYVGDDSAACLLVVLCMIIYIMNDDLTGICKSISSIRYYLASNVIWIDDTVYVDESINSIITVRTLVVLHKRERAVQGLMRVKVPENSWSHKHKEHRQIIVAALFVTCVYILTDNNTTPYIYTSILSKAFRY